MRSIVGPLGTSLTTPRTSHSEAVSSEAVPPETVPPATQPSLSPLHPCLLLLCLIPFGLLPGCGGADPGPPATGATDAAPAPPPPRGLFVDATVEAGLELRVTRPQVAGDHFMPDSMGPGVALLDFDGDGDLDLLRIGATRTPEGEARSETGADLLFENDGRGRFREVSAERGLASSGYGMGAAIGDIDGDGDPDVYLTRYGADRLLRNDDGRFVDVSDAGDPLGPGWSASAAFLDLEGDGDLDLFVTRYLDHDPSVTGEDAAGRPEYPAPAMFPGMTDRLYRNRGDGTFEDITDAAGLAGHRGRGLGVVVLDLDEDGRLDLVVANDGEPNFAWLAGADGRFTERAVELGLALNGEGRPEAGMGIDAGDCDGDGDLDLILTHLVRETHTLYRREGASFLDGTVRAGLAAATFPRTGFGVGFIDADLDGSPDLVALHGRVLRGARDPGTTLGPHWAPYAEPDALFLGDGAGRFREAKEEAGALATTVEVGRGLAWGDLDGDGDLDLVLTTADGALRLLRGTARDAEAPPHWLRVRAIDPRRGSDAIGATVRIRVGERLLTGLTGGGRSYLSAVDPAVHFGLGAESAVTAIEVIWPDRSRETFPGGGVDRTIELMKGEGQ